MKICNLKYSDGKSFVFFKLNDVENVKSSLERWIGSGVSLISENTMSFEFDELKMYLESGESFELMDHKFFKSINGVPILTNKAIDATSKFEDNESNLIAILRLQ